MSNQAKLDFGNDNDYKSQNKQILSWLQSGRPLTTLDAIKRFGCLKLNSRIFDLRKEGHNIHTQMSQISKRKRIAIYTLKKN